MEPQTAYIIIILLATIGFSLITFALGYALGIFYGKRMKQDEQKEYKIALTSIDNEGIIHGQALLDESFQEEKEKMEEFHSEFTESETKSFYDKIYDDMMERLKTNSLKSSVP